MFGTATATTSTTASFDNNIDGLIDGQRWTSASVSYSFTDSFSNDYESGYPNNSTYSSNFQTLNSTQRSVTRSWLSKDYFNVSLLNPFELTGASDRDATIRIAMATPVSNPNTAEAYSPANSVAAGDAFFRPGGYDSPTIGNYAYITFGHELGHALGLKHAHETGGVRNVAMNADRDSMEFSIMSYRSYIGASTGGGYTNEGWGYAQSLMMYDIRAIQQMYGAWFGSNASNTNYTFSTTTGEMFVNGVGQGTPGANRIFRTVWDGNGTDTYDFSNYGTNLSIDLTPGGWSDLDVGGNFQRANLGDGHYARGHVFNALQYNNDARSLIENANGGAGSDRILGNSANNVLLGNGGNDTINGGGGQDYMDGGAGIDTVDYSYWNGGGTYNLATGVASFTGFYNETIFNFENITTGAGNDNVTGSASNNLIVTGAGNDTVDGGAGDDIIYLGAGNDTVNISSAGNDTFYGEAGNDYIDGYFGNETYYGGDGDDTLKGRGGNDYINGGGGQDNMDGGDGIDTVDYGYWDGGGTYNLATGVASFAGFYNEQILNFENITTGAGNDNVTGSAANNLIVTGAGNDTVDGGAGDDIIYLGAGNDTVNISSAGNDTFYGEAGNDYIDGYFGNETYYGGDGDDTLKGRGGNDYINGGGGQDNMDGGDGIDTVDYGYWNGGGTYNLATGVASFAGFYNEQILNFENITTGAGNDNVTGSAANNLIVTGAGNDTVDGGAGDDTIYLGAGNDYVNISSLGNDTFYGEAGNDYIDGYTGNETFYGGDGNDTLKGYSGNDYINGGSGQDNMEGGAGIDTMIGGTGNDIYYVDNIGDIISETSTLAGEIDNVYSSVSNTLVLNVERLTLTGNVAINGSGNSLNNILVGNSGANTLYGGAGSDTLTGGLGADKFLFKNKTEGIDTITDFTSGDKIGISALGFGGGLVAGTAINASQLLVTSGSGATNASQRFVYNSANGGLSFDADGSGAGLSVQFATLSSNFNLTTSDFVIG